MLRHHNCESVAAARSTDQMGNMSTVDHQAIALYEEIPCTHSHISVSYKNL
jgi:hypothetical protein